MKKRIAIIGAVILALGTLAVAPLLVAQGRWNRAHADGEMGAAGFGALGRLARLREELDLSDEQADQIRAIVLDLREKNAPYRDQFRGGIRDAAQVLLANPEDVAGARAVLERQAATEKAMKENALSAISAALGVLNSDQRAKLAKLLDEHPGPFRRHGWS